MALEEFSASDLDILKQILSDVSQIKKDAMTVKQLRKVVPVEDWINDEYYVGKSGLFLYPYWKKQLIDIFGTHKGQYNEIIVGGGIGCLTLDHKYDTSEGLKSLLEVRELLYSGIDVKVDTENGVSRVIGAHIKGEEPTKKVRFSNGFTLEGTLNHRIRVLEEGKLVWRELGELHKGDIIPYLEKESPFTGIDYGEDKAYVFGYLVGDGSIALNRNNERVDVSILFDSEQSNCEYLTEVGGKILGTDKFFVRYLDSGKEFRVIRKINRDLAKEWDIYDEDSVKKLPDWVFTLSAKDKAQFVAGLWDSDGHVSDRGLEITLKSENIINGLQRLLTSLGIYSRVKSKTASCSSYNYESTVYKLTISGYDSWVAFYNKIPIQIDYKKNSLRSLVEGSHTRNVRTPLKTVASSMLKYHKNRPLSLSTKHRNLSGWTRGKQEIGRETFRKLFQIRPDWFVDKPDLKWLYSNNVRTIEVEDITDGFGLVGDIEVENHQYLINGIISHNTGKSTFALFCMLRRLYELSCYENVTTMFKLMPNTILAFLYFSVNQRQAEVTGFGQFRNTLDSIGYFRENFLRDEKINSILRFPENILFLSGSSTNQAIGMNMIGAILDEANFYQNNAQDASKTESDYSKVSQMYDAIVNRGRSRFMAEGKDESLCILVSSNTTTSSFTEHRIKMSAGNPHVKVINARLWEVKPKGTYSDKTFSVFTGSNQIDPFIIETIEDIYQVTDSMQLIRPFSKDIDEAIKELPIQARDKFLKIPEDFRRSFEENIIQALQDIGGFSVAPMGRLFSSRPTYQKACENNPLTHPFTKDEIIISTGDNLKVHDYLRRDWRPFRRDAKRYIHIDQSYANDSTGFASCYRDGFIVDEITGIRKPVVAVEMQLRINPPKMPAQISITKVKDFVIYMRDKIGLNIGKVTYDQFASAQARQELNEVGINAEYQSVDKTDEAYLLFCNLLYEGRIKMYYHKTTETELFDLIHFRDKHKVDHPSSSHKDLMDAIVGAVYNCIMDEDESLGVTSYNDVSVTASMFGSGDTDLDDLTNYILYDYS